jgi:signal transduction histidine kinase
MLNPFAISGIATAVTASSLGAFVYLKDRNRRLYRYWLAFSAAVTVWGIGSVLIANCQNPETSLWLWRCSFAAGVIWIPIFFLGFVYEFCGFSKRPILLNVGFVAGIVFSLAAFSPLFLSSTRRIFGSFYYGVPGSALFLVHFIWWSFLFVSSLTILIRSMSKADAFKQRQIQYTFFGIALGALGGTSNFLPFFKIDWYPWANFAIPVYTAVITYAIIRHQLMEIEVVIKRATVFAGLFAFVYGVVAIFTVLGQGVFQTLLGWPVWTAMIPSILIITLTLRPLENWLIDVTEKYLFQKKYDYRELMRLFTGEVLTIFDYNQVTRNTVEALNNIIKLESCAVILKDEATSSFKMVTGIGVREAGIEFGSEDPIIHYLRTSQSHLHINSDLKGAPAIRTLQQDFKRLNSAICIPIIFRKELVGFLSLGAKKSGDAYNQDDIDILMSLARTEAIAISNARLFEKLSATQAEAAQNEKMAVVGTLAAGINHEICNPLGIVRGQCEMFLLNYRDGIYGQIPDKQVIEQVMVIFGKIIKETDRATAITKRLSNFAKPNKAFKMTEVDVPRELGEVLAILEHEMKIGNIEVENRIPEDFPQILADRRQIQEVIFNIMRNAVQAMEGSGRIVVAGSRNGTRATVTIADTGQGISPDKIGLIFNPFFTTKDPGKGTGLGLFIVKQIVERNEGSISVASEIGKGTQFTLTFNLAHRETAPELTHA